MLLSGCGGNAENITQSSNQAQMDSVEKNMDQGSISFPKEGVGEELPEASRLERSFDGLQDTEWSETNHSMVFFTPETNSVTAQDGTRILYESYDRIDFSAADPELNVWGDSQLKQIEQTFQSNSAELLKEAQQSYRDQKDTFYCYSNYLNMGVARHDQRVMSVLAINSMYSGGAHPLSEQSAYNMDLETKESLTLEDIIEPTAGDEISELVLSGVEKSFATLGPQSLYNDYTDTISSFTTYGSMTKNWYFDHTSLVVFFNQYEIAPYAAGIIKVEIPYDQLHGILKEEYIPQHRASGMTDGDLVVTEASSVCQSIPVKIGDGPKVTVGTEDTVYQVQLSEVHWLDQTPISKRIILSMNEFDPLHVLEIETGNTTEDQNYAIEFYNGMGEQRIYYIHPEGLSEKP